MQTSTSQETTINRHYAPSIRDDVHGVKKRLLDRDCNTSWREFVASNMAAILLLLRRDDPNPVESVTVHAGRKSSGNPLFTLTAPEEGVEYRSADDQRIFTLRNLRDASMALCAAVQQGRPVPIWRETGDRCQRSVVAIAVMPSGVAYG